MPKTRNVFQRFFRRGRSRSSRSKTERGRNSSGAHTLRPALLTEANLTAVPSAPHFIPCGLSDEELFSDLLKPQAAVENTFDQPEERPSRRFRSAPPGRHHGGLPLGRRFDRNVEREAGESRGRSKGSSMTSFPSIRKVHSAERHSDSPSPSPQPWDISNKPELPEFVRARRERRSRRDESRRRSDEHAPTPVSSQKVSRNEELSAIFGFVWQSYTHTRQAAFYFAFTDFLMVRIYQATILHVYSVIRKIERRQILNVHSV